jgi:hypothetical protein
MSHQLLDHVKEPNCGWYRSTSGIGCYEENAVDKATLLIVKDGAPLVQVIDNGLEHVTDVIVLNVATSKIRQAA